MSICAHRIDEQPGRIVCPAPCECGQQMLEALGLPRKPRPDAVAPGEVRVPDSAREVQPQVAAVAAGNEE